MDTLQFATVPVIITVTYGVINILKRETKSTIKNLPLVAAIIGAILGAIAFFAAPGIMPTTNAFTAILIGGASGLAATGSHQILKQFSQKDEGGKSDGDKTG